MLVPGVLATIDLSSWMESWRKLYSTHVAISTVVLFVHLAAILIAGGLTISTDRHVIALEPGDMQRRMAQLADGGQARRTIIHALVVVILTGIALTLADTAVYWTMPAFWVKMGLFVALLANALMMRRCNERRIRLHARLSVALWMMTLLAGTALTAG